MTTTLFAYAIETSSSVGSAALVTADRVIAEQSFSKGLRHGTDLVPALDAVVHTAAIDRAAVGLVVVGIGPGSYTGIRVGLASAKTLAFALGVPLVGVVSSDAAVYSLPPDDVYRAAVVIDARRGYVYLSTYNAHPPLWNLVGDHRIMPPEHVAACVQPGTLLLGDGVLRYRSIFVSQGLRLAEDVSPNPTAGWIGKLGIMKFNRSRTDELLTAEPLYLRLSEPEEKRHSTT